MFLVLRQDLEALRLIQSFQLLFQQIQLLQALLGGCLLLFLLLTLLFLTLLSITKLLLQSEHLLFDSNKSHTYLRLSRSFQLEPFFLMLLRYLGKSSLRFLRVDIIVDNVLALLLVLGATIATVIHAFLVDLVEVIVSTGRLNDVSLHVTVIIQVVLINVVDVLTHHRGIPLQSHL